MNLKPDEKLLGIRQAAALLGVSEMSLRRWTNSGKLNCLRLGPKRERRFRLADLEAFLCRDEGVPLGFSGLRARRHAHISHFYVGENASLKKGLAYISRGLDLGEFVLAMSPAGRGNTLLKALEQAGRPVQSLIESGRLQIFAGMRDQEAQNRLVDDFMARAGRENAPFRLLGDMTWTREQKWSLDQLFQLEKETNHQKSNNPSLFLCQYDLAAFPGEVAFMALQTHDHGIYRDKLEKSPYFDQEGDWPPLA